MKKATIEIDRDYLIIDGMRVNFEIIPQFLYEFAHPDPRKWYRLERRGEECLVHVEIRDLETSPPRRCPHCKYETTQPFNFCPKDGMAMQPAPELQAIRDMHPGPNIIAYVKHKYPEAFAYRPPTEAILWLVKDKPDGMQMLGQGETEAEAWLDAQIKIASEY